MKYWNEKTKKLMTEEEMKKAAEAPTDDNSNGEDEAPTDEAPKRGRSRK